MKELLRLRKYLSNYRTPVLLGIASVVLTKLFQLAVPWLTGLAVGNIDSQRRSLTFVSYCVAAIVAVVLAEGFTEFIWRRKLIPVFHRVAFHLRNDLYQHLLKLSFSWFNTMKTGDIMSRTANDIQTIRGVIEFGIANMLRNIVLFVGATILMFFISVQLTLLTLMSLLIITVAIKFLGPRMFRLSMVVQERIATISAHAQENFSGIRVVKAFAVEEIESKKFDSLSREYVDSSMDLARLRAFMMPLFMTVAQIGILVTLWFGGRDIIFAEFDLGKFVAFVGYQQMMLWPMASFGFILTFLQRGAASMARINRILNEEPEIRDDHRTGEDVQLRGDIEFKNLSFQYPRSIFSLKDVNLRIPAGTTVGIVGPVGSGKSSFASLIMRLFDVPDGTLFLDGRDINTIPIRRVRSSIGYVPQDSFLFSETIRENISFGNPEVDFAQVVKAAKIAQVADDIEEFSDKYDQLIGERGVTLSGGQKQRVAIARALALDPAILILDDALSSVDTHTEDAILQGLRSISKKRTTLIISHRISTVASADFTIVFDDGQIAERGSHDELLAQGGLYASIYHKQQLEAQIESEGD